MVELFLTTTITCSQAISVINRLKEVVGLTPDQKTEIVKEIKQSIPLCPYSNLNLK